MIKTYTGVYLTRPEARRQIAALQGGKCCYCGVTLTWNTTKQPPRSDCATLEHIVPVSLGGADHENNLAVSCFSCNGRRGMIPHADFLLAMRRMKS